MQNPRTDVGASAVEYGLMIAAIAAIIVASVLILGDFTGALFTDSCTEIESTSPSADSC